MCDGPCEQGKKPCPCPAACQINDLDVLESVGKIVIGVLACVGLGVCVAWFVGL